MILAIEDDLSSAVGEKLVRHASPAHQISAVIGGRGKGYLRTKARELNRTARTVPVFLLTDQDSTIECAPALIREWFGNAPALVCRVAILEVEAWLLADADRLSRYLCIPGHRISRQVESIADPKQYIVNLARRSRSKDVRDDLVPTIRSTARVGPAFNARLIDFVVNHWDPEHAAILSPSLRRAIAALSALG